MGSGTEVALALDAAEALDGELRARVVSMPCMDTFNEQDQSYRDSVLPPDVKARVAVEAASPMSWYRWIGDGGAVIGMTDYGRVRARARGLRELRHHGRGRRGRRVAGSPDEGRRAAHTGASGPRRLERRDGARRARLRPHLGARRHALGARGDAGDRQPPRLARVAEAHPGGARRDRRVRRRGARRRHDRRRRARHGRLEPRARGLPPGRSTEAARNAAPARARHHRAAAGAGGRGAARPRQDAVRRLLEVGRDDRAQRALQALPRPAAGRIALRRRHGPRHADGRDRDGARLPPHLRQRPRHRRSLLRAVVLRDRARRRWPAVDVGTELGAAVAAQRASENESGPVARRGARRRSPTPVATSSASSSTRRSSPSDCGWSS